MLVVIEWYQLYICIIIIIGMNVVDNLNSVKVINKLCMSSRRMSLLPRATLHSDSEQKEYPYFRFADLLVQAVPPLAAEVRRPTFHRNYKCLVDCCTSLYFRIFVALFKRCSGLYCTRLYVYYGSSSEHVNAMRLQ